MSGRSTHTSLLDWFHKQPNTEFPPAAGTSYPKRLNQVADILNSEIHPHVATGASLSDGSLLTDHGPSHIETVIKRASRLLAHPQNSFPQFSAYEIYIFLLAAHFHDVGNVFGRAGHEQKLSKVMAEFNESLGNEMVERHAVQTIARAHSGRIDGSKDTIPSLLKEEFVLGQRVRYRALAAVLRFSDELADDCHRATHYLGELGVIPPGSEVFHAYAKSLHTVDVDPVTGLIRLRYCFLRADATRKFGKSCGTSEHREVYLLDEIYERTIKMHLERIYCMRFLRNLVQIDAIEVSIDVYDEMNSPTPCIDTIGYRLQEEGYPRATFSHIEELCPSIPVDGASLSQRLQEGNHQW